jgi:hypothetical protein
MTRIYDDFDEFEFDDSFAVRKMLQEMRRDELRRAIRRKRGHTQHRPWEDFDGDEDSDYDDYENYEEYEDYDNDEFDSYS